MPKICSRCHQTKSLDQFYRVGKKSERRANYCIPCIKIYNKERMEQNPYYIAHNKFKAGDKTAYKEL